MTNAHGPSTASVHAGEPRIRPSHSVTEPIIQGVAFPFADTADMVEFLNEKRLTGESERVEYGRYGNPTCRAAEAKLAAMESSDGNPYGEVSAILTSSGMAATTGFLLYMVRSGDHLILTENCYSGTYGFCRDFLPRYDVQVTAIRGTKLEDYAAAIRPNTKLIYAESPSNPFNRCLDLAGIAKLATDRGIVTAVDNTFATPFNSRPLELGINYVIHSVTKYLSGHNDVIAGVVIGSAWEMTALRSIQHELGMVLDSFSCYQIMRGLKTFGLRMARHNANGQAVAAFLEQHPKIERVWYAGLASHPDHALATAQLRGFGGVVSFELADHEHAARFVDRLTIPHVAGSLGAVESLVHQPWLLSYFEVPQAERERLGIKEGLVRLACGIEDTEDLVEDVRQALEAA